MERFAESLYNPAMRRPTRRQLSRVLIAAALIALVIAATALISALNALTLKPTQCALYLRPKKPGSRPNMFYRGFNPVSYTHLTLPTSDLV